MNTERCFWLLVIGCAALYVCDIVAGWIRAYRERQRVRRILAP